MCPEEEQLRKTNVVEVNTEKENSCETEAVLSVEGKALKILSYGASGADEFPSWNIHKYPFDQRNN